jgi:hypothetical protein
MVLTFGHTCYVAFSFFPRRRHGSIFDSPENNQFTTGESILSEAKDTNVFTFNKLIERRFGRLSSNVIKALLNRRYFLALTASSETHTLSNGSLVEAKILFEIPIHIHSNGRLDAY